MNKILEKEKLAEDTFLIKLFNPDIAKKAKPGQFIILRIDKKGERIPLTIADYDNRSVTIVFKAAGFTTKRLSKLKKNDMIQDMAGPLGNPSKIEEEVGDVLLVGGGLGIAPLYPIAREFKKKGNNVTIMIGARSKKNFFWLDKLKKVSDDLILCTEDGSVGEKGYVTNCLRYYVQKNDVKLCHLVGPVMMMRECAKYTNSLVKTMASLNPIMVDGVGMCGGCRVVVGNTVKFACVDGPEFDAHLVDWDELMNRNKSYEQEEHECKCLKHETKKRA